MPFSEFQRHHHRAAACVQPRFVRRHIIIKQALRTHIDGVVLFTAFYRAVCGKVFATLVITQ